MNIAVKQGNSASIFWIVTKILLIIMFDR